MSYLRGAQRFGLVFLGTALIIITIWNIFRPDKPPNDGAKVAHRLAVIVPFRERFSALLSFLPHMHAFLQKKGIPHTFYIINQADDYRFNRGALLNVGVKESSAMETRYFESTTSAWTMPLPGCEMVVLHDVDLLPADDGLRYEHFGLKPYHLIPYWMHPIYYTYTKYIGGAVIISRESFGLVNGFSNRFWGWGREDDEFGLRMREANLVVESEKKPEFIVQKFINIHTKGYKRDRDPSHNPITHRRDHETGLNNIQYTVLSRMPIKIDSVSAWIINTQLSCDILETPYCQSM